MAETDRLKEIEAYTCDYKLMPEAGVRADVQWLIARVRELEAQVKALAADKQYQVELVEKLAAKIAPGLEGFAAYRPK